MIKEVTKKIDQITSLCQKYNVKRLDLIGSAVNGKFDKKKSDLDFLVEFHSMTPVEHSNSYFSLLADLQDLFNRNIDLIEIQAIQNPHFLESVVKGKSVLYAA